jgi:tRNA G46 methylase TrmB
MFRTSGADATSNAAASVSWRIDGRRRVGREFRSVRAASTVSREEDKASSEALEERKIKQRAHRKRNRQRNKNAVREEVGSLLDAFVELEPLGKGVEKWEEVYDARKSAEVAWGELPPRVDPYGTNKKGGDVRGLRKRNQVQAFVTHLEAILEENDGKSRKVVCDFGCGTGNVVMTAAALFPNHDFIGVDLNQKSIDILNERIVESGLSNVSARVGLIEECDALEVDVVLALHVCGSATDFVINSAIERRKPFIVAPCCVGKVQKGGMRSLNRMRNDLIRIDERHVEIDRPRSSKMKEAGFDFDTYMSAAGLADFSGHQGIDPSDPNEPLTQLPRRAKSAIEADRAEFARECGFDVALYKMPTQSGIRDDIIVGLPNDV